jgi:hypothetical protein
VTEAEIEAVAEELAKVGGVSWYPGRTKGALLRSVSERYRDRAKVAIATLDRLRAAQGTQAGMQEGVSITSSVNMGPTTGASDQLQVGAVVVYRPPNDKRAIACRIEKLEQGRAYLVPCQRPDVGWVALDSLEPLENGALAKQI